MNVKLQISSHCARKKLFSCNICKKQFKRKWNLTSHENRVHGKVTPRHLHCTFCNKDFMTYRKLEYHTGSHIKEKPYHCNMCSSCFTERGTLRNHMKRIHSNIKGSIPCQICNKMFHTRWRMMDHLSVHTGERPHKCNICGATFAKNYRLKTHLSSHGKIRENKESQCYLCDKVFARKTNMTAHMKTHLNERPHKCEFCMKSFVTFSDMKCHLTVHNVGNHICVFCTKRFSKYCRLEAHVVSHTKEKPNFCQFCDKGFSKKDNLLRHVRKVHKL